MPASENQQLKELYEFGPFRVDPEKEILLRAGELVPLTPKTFQILLVLVRHNKEVVTKDDLMKSVWPDTFVEEANLSRNIFMLRKALGESPQDHQYILTVPGRGYRLAESVRLVPEREVSIVAAQHSKMQIQVKESSSWQWVVAGATVLLLGLAALYLGRRATRDPVAVTGAKVMLAVLPFENLTGDPTNEYFSDGLTEEMITQLATLQPSRLGVIARTSVMAYKRGDKSISHVGSQLGVQYILEGSLRQSSGRVRITAQLIQVKDQTHLWAQDYDRDLGDMLTLEREVSGDVAREIQLELTSQQQANLAQPRPVDPEAHELYLKGRFYWNLRTPDGFKRSVEYFQSAIRKDPNYAEAYVGLADAYRFLMNALPPDEVLPEARAAAEKALAINPNLAEAHASLGLIAPYYDWDWEGARKHLERALELNPNSALTHDWYADGYLSIMGRMDESLAEMRVAHRLDPLSCVINGDMGKTLFFARKYDEAIAQLSSVLEMDPNCYVAMVWLRSAYWKTGRSQEALNLFQKERTFFYSDADNLVVQAEIYALMGRNEQARQSMAQLVKAAQKEHVDPGNIAAVYIALGDKDQAFAWLEKAYAEHSNYMSSLKVWGLYDPLRSDPRFVDLERRVKLIQ